MALLDADHAISGKRSPVKYPCTGFGDHRLLLLFHATPCSVRVDPLYFFGDLQSLRAKVFFVDHSVVAHHEALDSRDTVLRRRGDECEAADHDALNAEIHLTERRGRAL